MIETKKADFKREELTKEKVYVISIHSNFFRANFVSFKPPSSLSPPQKILISFSTDLSVGTYGQFQRARHHPTKDKSPNLTMNELTPHSLSFLRDTMGFWSDSPGHAWLALCFCEA